MPSEARGTKSDSAIPRAAAGGPSIAFRGSSPRTAHDDGANQFPAIPCFRMIARLASVNFAGQSHPFFINLLKMQPLACRRNEADLAGNPDGLSREESRVTGKEQGDRRRRSEPAKATRLRLYRRGPKARPPANSCRSRAKAALSAARCTFKPTECANYLRPRVQFDSRVSALAQMPASGSFKNNPDNGRRIDDHRAPACRFPVITDDFIRSHVRDRDAGRASQCCTNRKRSVRRASAFAAKRRALAPSLSARARRTATVDGRRWIPASSRARRSGSSSSSKFRAISAHSWKSGFWLSEHRHQLRKIVWWFLHHR